MIETVRRKLALFPLGATIDSAGQLCLRGTRAADLAARFDTPLYVYDVATIEHQIKTYRQALLAYPGPARLTYASKAFLCPALAGLMHSAGVGLDVASAGEIFIARRGGADPIAMHLHGNNKTWSDLGEALQAGVGCVVVDNTAELDRLSQLAVGRPAPVKVWLRITPGIAVDTHHAYTVTGAADSKFGLAPAEAEVVAGRLIEAGPGAPLRLTGLHCHLGSHFHQAGPMVVAIERLLELAGRLGQRYGWQMQEFCPGGGWAVPYLPEDPPKPPGPFVQIMAEALVAGCQRRGLPLPQLVLEPGRSLVAQAGLVLYTVGGRKVISGVRTYVSVDGGLADNPRPALYGARYTALMANRAGEPEVETVAVAGPHCETGDILIGAVELPVASPGDLLAVPVAGAYQLAMSSNYNAALRPAVLFIEAGQARLVQRRESYEDLVRRDI